MFTPTISRRYAAQAVRMARRQRRSARHCSTSVLETQTLKVTALGSLYEQWPNIKPYLPPVPPKDVTLELSYTRLKSEPVISSNDDEKPLGRPLQIVAFHGSPGTAAEFDSFAQALGQKVYIDFIAPTFPSVSFTLNERKFWHSAEEKLALAEILLEQIGVTEVDVAIGHSAGSYPAILMCLRAQKIKAKSLILLNSTGFRLLPVLQPDWFLTRMTRMLWTRPLDKAVFAFFEVIMKTQNLGNMTAYDAICSVATQYATRFWDRDRGPQWKRELETLGIPRLAMFGLKDRLVPRRYNRYLASDLGNPDVANHIIYEGKIEADLKCVNKPESHELPPMVSFHEGGHFVFQQYPDVTSQHVAEFLQRTFAKT